MPDTPLNRYQADLQRPGFVDDPAQCHAVQHLQDLYDHLLSTHSATRWGRKGVTAYLQRQLPFLRRAQPRVQGVYFWGGVGRGKTYLMDVFFESLPFEAKLRTHFHRFMRRVHQELTTLKHQSNPLDIVAERLAEEARVICFDEFFVVDITDAMLLAGLLESLFKRRVVLVATSNIAPDGLYENGLQRDRFMPAIALLNQHTRVVNVDGGVDYRLRALERAPLYYLSSNPQVQVLLGACFSRLTPEHAVTEIAVPLDIENRTINARQVAEDVAWFQFAEVCDGPRSQNDYIELAREFHAIIVEGVPCFGSHNDDQARRFIYLVDEFYDRNVKLILSAAVEITALYGQGRLAFEFQRTISRVQEMQSKVYLARAHRA